VLAAVLPAGALLAAGATAFGGALETDFVPAGLAAGEEPPSAPASAQATSARIASPTSSAKKRRRQYTVALTGTGRTGNAG